MSVILQNEKCAYISHNKYIQKAYQEQFKLNEDLFEIHAPFKKQTLKRKLRGETLETTFREIIQDTEYVSKEYGKFYKVLKSGNVFDDKINVGVSNDSKKKPNKDGFDFNNTKALEASDKLCEESGSGLPMKRRFNNVKALETSGKLYEESGSGLLMKRSFNNAKALEVSAKLYEESGSGLPMNTNGGNLLKTALVDIGNNKYLFPENSVFYCKNVRDLKSDLSSSKFDLILMDPPWWNKAVRRKNLKNNHGYKMMSNEELREMPVGDLLGDNGIVVLWCTNSPQHIRACDGFFEEWGVELVARWFWLKVCKNGETVINFSEPPSKLPFERILIARKIRKNFDSPNKKRKTINQTENSFLTKQTNNEETVKLNKGSSVNSFLTKQTNNEETVTLNECSSEIISNRENLCGRRLEDTNGNIIISVPSALHSHKPPLVEVLRPYLKTSAKCLEVFARYLLPGYTSYGLEVLRFQNVCLYEKNS